MRKNLNILVVVFLLVAAQAHANETLRPELRVPLYGAVVSSPFGTRIHPIWHSEMFHSGVDFAAPANTPVFATSPGTISYIGMHPGYGNYVKIRHSNQLGTAYGHLASFAPHLKKGDHVGLGQPIGYAGNTGNSTAPHLHYEVIVNGEFVDPLEVAE